MKLIFYLLMCLHYVNSLSAQKLIQISSKNPEAIAAYQQGFKAADQGELSTAALLYAKALKYDSSFAMAYMQLSLLQEKFSERTRLMAKAMEHVALVSEGERLWIYGRNSFYGTGKREEEYNFFEKLVELYPEDPASQYLFGYMNHHHGRKDLTKAIHHLEKSVNLDSNYFTALDDLASAYMESEDFANAERIVLREIQLQPHNIKPVDSYAKMLFRKGDYYQSIAHYQKALQLDSVYPWSIYGIAANLNFLGRYQDARQYISKLKVVQLSERESYHLMLAYQCSYVDEGKIDSAIYILDQYGVKARENNLITQRYLSLTNKARIQLEFGQGERGYKTYEELLTFVETTSNETLKKQTLNQRSYYEAFKMYTEGSLNPAKALLVKNIQEGLLTDDPTRLLLAKIYLKENDHHETIKLLMGCNQDNPTVQFLLAEVYVQSGKRTAAKVLLLKIARRNEMQELDYHLVRKKSLQLLGRE